MSNSSSDTRRRLHADSVHRPKVFREGLKVMVAGILLLMAVGGGFMFVLTKGLSSVSWFKVATDSQRQGGSKEERAGQDARAPPLKADLCKRSILDHETGHLIDIIRPCSDIAVDAAGDVARQGADRWHR